MERIMQAKSFKYEHVTGSGHQIKAYIEEKVPCVEFTMKKNCHQTVLIGVEPFVQFAPNKWNNLIKTLFSEMVDLWNNKDRIKDLEKENAKLKAELKSYRVKNGRCLRCGEYDCEGCPPKKHYT